MNEVWAKWENLVINGTYPLRRYLSHSDHSVVFQTESQGAGSASAALKIIPADPARADRQLSIWKTVAALSHPHLIRVLDTGRCQLGGHDFIFVVMEYADQTLAQILPHRALTADEVREMMPPILDALSFLHRKSLVHGRLKPPNILVVGEQLKLASDTIRHAGQSTAANATLTPYDPPESHTGQTFAAGDIWALGVTLVEALTLRPPSWPDERSDNAALPVTIPPGLRDILRRCLRRDPANRPSTADLVTLFGKPPPVPVALAPTPAAAPAPALTPTATPMVDLQPARAAAPVPVPVPVPVPAARPVPAAEKRDAVPRPSVPADPPQTRSIVPGLVGILIVVAAVGIGTWLLRSRTEQPLAEAPVPISDSAQTVARASAPASTPPNPTVSSSPTATSMPPAPAPAPAPRTVIHQEIPDASRGARDTIHGDLKILVRITVDRSGTVTAETLQSQASSKYFSRLATEAARKWTFSPSPRDNDQWVLRFDFTREGVTGHAESE